MPGIILQTKIPIMYQRDQYHILVFSWNIQEVRAMHAWNILDNYTNNRNTCNAWNVPDNYMNRNTCKTHIIKLVVNKNQTEAETERDSERQRERQTETKTQNQKQRQENVCMYLIQGIVLYDFNSPWQNFEFRADITPSMSVLFFLVSFQPITPKRS